MKKHLLSAAFAAAGLAATASGAHAADGTITLTGQVMAATCTIKGNNTSNNFTVTLPTVSTSTLSAAGATAGRTQFTINLSNCSGATKVSTYFEQGSTVDANTGRLNVTGGATNVQLAVLDDSFNTINIGPSQSSQQATLSSGSANLNYYVQYYAKGAATAGTANSSVQYTIAYQ